MLEGRLPFRVVGPRDSDGGFAALRLHSPLVAPSVERLRAASSRGAPTFGLATVLGVIEPMISLAFAVHSNRGAYVPLLGSGISRAAGIPSGWEVVLDLIERVATLNGTDTQGDPAGWHRTRYGNEPDYAALLSELAGSPAERNRLLRAYFEPTDEDREQGLKLPTAAHHAIARLVANGFVRVVVTTNFDRLLESALEQQGIVPTTIATPDAAEGALPLAHTRCTLVKVHGDYLDARIKNTPEELAEYDARVNSLLDRILDEYGLIVCGWSAEWDTALRDAMSRCASHRFTTYWAARGEPIQAARALVELRRAVTISIDDADSFFVELEGKVAALDELSKPHPLSAKLAVAALKRYLADPRHRIRLFDLINNEVARVGRETSDEAFPVSGDWPTAELVQGRLDRYEAICGPLMGMLSVGSYWGEADHRPLWTSVLDRLANRWTEHGGLETWLNLRHYPVVLALHASGIGAVAAKKYETLAALLSSVTVRRFNEDEPLILAHHVVHVVEETLVQPEAGRGRLLTPASDRLSGVLREPLREFLPSDAQYEDAFDTFEYLLSLAYADYRDRDGGRLWAPAGSFRWRQRRRGDTSVFARVAAEADAAGENWGLLQTSLFDGSLERFRAIKTSYDQEVLPRLNAW